MMAMLVPQSFDDLVRERVFGEVAVKLDEFVRDDDAVEPRDFLEQRDVEGGGFDGGEWMLVGRFFVAAGHEECVVRFSVAAELGDDDVGVVRRKRDRAELRDVSMVVWPFVVCRGHELAVLEVEMKI